MTREDVEQIRQELDQVERTPDGRLLVDDVIEAAKENKDWELHKRFNWNIKEAALEHWREVCRRVIRQVHITKPDGSGEVTRHYINLTPSGEEQGYHILAEVLDDKERRVKLLLQSKREAENWLSSFQMKYGQLSELDLSILERAVKRTFAGVDDIE
ncbi:hypothetical protein LCGC14_0326260 [marine sediment metagenome]|uniref:Uncharacterized protein n=1 Tax=marine sediment metagenome TaxID=412755 RepID=A0A0F9THZ2_9ZZZZ